MGSKKGICVLVMRAYGENDTEEEFLSKKERKGSELKIKEGGHNRSLIKRRKGEVPRGSKEGLRQRAASKRGEKERFKKPHRNLNDNG